MTKTGRQTVQFLNVSSGAMQQKHKHWAFSG